LRIGTVRHLPRGVRKSEYRSKNYFDVWLPVLAPSQALLKAFRAGSIPARTFFRKYRAEMAQTGPRQVIRLLAELARHTPFSVGCYCDDESQCHRSILGELIRAAASNAH
jgi:uncharacterized protein YeaO (DUF488 family)